MCDRFICMENQFKFIDSVFQYSFCNYSRLIEAIKIAIPGDTMTSNKSKAIVVSCTKGITSHHNNTRHWHCRLSTYFSPSSSFALWHSFAMTVEIACHRNFVIESLGTKDGHMQCNSILLFQLFKKFSN